MEEQYKDKLKSTASDIQGRGQAAAESVKREGREFADQAKERLDSEVSARKGMVAKELGYLGDALNKSAGELEKNDSALTEPIRQVAQFCDRSAQSVSRKGTRELLAQAESFGRDQPLLFIGAAIAAGFVATRLLRSDTGKAVGSSESRGGERSFEHEQPAFERHEGEAIAQTPSPAVTTSETVSLTGPGTQGERPFGTT
jgi:ElaB/YqjD/DUF883 family membrane-anchored ribosome-binding protein